MPSVWSIGAATQRLQHLSHRLRNDVLPWSTTDEDLVALHDAAHDVADAAQRHLVAVRHRLEQARHPAA